MFEVVMMICALVGREPDFSRCAKITDTYGPYRTERNCLIRLNQMVSDMQANEEFKIAIAVTLLSPGGVRVIGKCENKTT